MYTVLAQITANKSGVPQNKVEVALGDSRPQPEIERGVVMGIGKALMEHTSYNPRSGAPINSNYADYFVPVNADVPPLEVHFLDYPDKEANSLGARCIGVPGV